MANTIKISLLLIATISVSLFVVSCHGDNTKAQKNSAVTSKKDSTTPSTTSVRKRRVPDNLMSDLEKVNLHGRVKSLIEHSYYLKEKDGKFIKGKLWFWIKYRYDSLGNELWQSEYDLDGYYAGDTMNNSFLYTFDSKGKVIKKFENTGWGRKGLIADSNNCYNTEKYTYNKKGWVIETFSEARGMPLNTKTLYQYDTAGNMTEYKYYDLEDSSKEVERQIYKYDNYGDKVEGYALEYENRMNDKSIYKYDANGNEIACYDSNSKHFFLRQTKKYDDKNNQTELVIYKPKGAILTSIKYSYEYDNTGNWVTETTTSIIGSSPTIVSERVIEYY